MQHIITHFINCQPWHLLEGIKTVKKMGSIDATAKKFGVDLTKYCIRVGFVYNVLINNMCVKLIRIQMFQFEVE